MNLENKICLVTGANSGIGKHTVMELARKGAYVVMLCRNEEKALRARQEIIDDTGHSGIEIIVADLAHQFDIRQAAEQYREKFKTLDILVNNAGIITSRRQETPEGIERTFAINYLAPFLLTNLLLEPLQKAPSARVINVSSEVHRRGVSAFDIDDLQLKSAYSPMKAYGVSKLCVIMFTYELAKRFKESAITANSLHPGMVSTRLADEASWLMKLFYLAGKPFMRSPAEGAKTTLYLATAEEAENISGKYFRNQKISAPAPLAFDDEVTRQLWKRSKNLTGLS